MHICVKRRVYPGIERIRQLPPLKHLSEQMLAQQPRAPSCASATQSPQKR